jgi:hypothetical protein
VLEGACSAERCAILEFPVMLQFQAGRLDEIIVQVGSVTLGRGKPPLPWRIASPPSTLVSVRQPGAGFAELRCRVGRPPTSA